jgi:gluconate kinase
MLDRIMDSCDGDDGYYGLDEYGHPVHQEYIDPMGDYIPMEDDDRRQWEQEMEQKDEEYEAPTFAPVSNHEMLFRHLDLLKKMYCGK